MIGDWTNLRQFADVAETPNGANADLSPNQFVKDQNVTTTVIVDQRSVAVTFMAPNRHDPTRDASTGPTPNQFRCQSSLKYLYDSASSMSSAPG